MSDPFNPSEEEIELAKTRYDRELSIEEMKVRAYGCGGRPLNNRDNVVVDELWLATLQVTRRQIRIETKLDQILNAFIAEENHGI